MTRTHLLLLSTLLLPACGGDDSITIPPPEPLPTPTIQLAVSQPSPVTANVATIQGTLGSSSITRSEGFSGPVTMTAESVPTGWTVTYSPAILGGSVTSSVVQITAPANVAAGSYSFIVRATAVGIATASREMTVVANVDQGN